VTLTEPEQQLADKMATYWTNFAKFGNPSPFITEGLPLWLPYSEKKVLFGGKFLNGEGGRVGWY
jgi:hypothetical protein